MIVCSSDNQSISIYLAFDVLFSTFSPPHTAVHVSLLRLNFTEMRCISRPLSSFCLSVWSSSPSFYRFCQCSLFTLSSLAPPWTRGGAGPGGNDTCLTGSCLRDGHGALFNFALLCVQEHTLAHQHKQIQRLTLFLFTLMNKEISKKMGLLRGFTDPKPPKDVNTRFICWDWTAAIQSKTDDLIFQTSSRDNYKPIQLITSSIRITRLAHTLKTSF